MAHLNKSSLLSVKSHTTRTTRVTQSPPQSIASACNSETHVILEELVVTTPVNMPHGEDFLRTCMRSASDQVRPTSVLLFQQSTRTRTKLYKHIKQTMTYAIVVRICTYVHFVLRVQPRKLMLLFTVYCVQVNVRYIIIVTITFSMECYDVYNGPDTHAPNSQRGFSPCTYIRTHRVVTAPSPSSI